MGIASFVRGYLTARLVQLCNKSLSCLCMKMAYCALSNEFAFQITMEEKTKKHCEKHLRKRHDILTIHWKLMEK